MATGVSNSLVEQQIKQWELAHRQSSDTRAPCVALSRLPGTPGAEIGQNVAAALGYGFFGIELVDEIARTEHVRADLVKHLDEHVRSHLDRYVLDVFRDSSFIERDYLHSVGRTLRTLGEKGGAVVLGRGAPFVLDAHRTLRVQLIASRKFRVARLAAAKQCSSAEAEAQLTREESDRLKFLSEFVQDPDSPAHFDLIINTEYRSVAYWSDVIVHALQTLTSGEPRS